MYEAYKMLKRNSEAMQSPKFKTRGVCCGGTGTCGHVGSRAGSYKGDTQAGFGAAGNAAPENTAGMTLQSTVH